MANRSRTIWELDNEHNYGKYETKLGQQQPAYSTSFFAAFFKYCLASVKCPLEILSNIEFLLGLIMSIVRANSQAKSYPQSHVTPDASHQTNRSRVVCNKLGMLCNCNRHLIVH